MQHRMEMQPKLIRTVAQNEQPVDDPEHDRDGHPRNAQTQNQRGSVEDQSSDNAASRWSLNRQADAEMIMAKLHETSTLSK